MCVWIDTVCDLLVHTRMHLLVHTRQLCHERSSLVAGMRSYTYRFALLRLFRWHSFKTGIAGAAGDL